MRQISPVWQRETPKAGRPCHPGASEAVETPGAPPFPESVIHRELAFQAQIPRQSRQRVLTGVSSEWPLVKAAITAGAAFPVAAAVGDFYEAAARLIEQWVRFRPALDRPRFLAVGATADEIAREVEQQVLPGLAARPLVGSFGDGLAVLTEGINATLEADPF